MTEDNRSAIHLACNNSSTLAFDYFMVVVFVWFFFLHSQLQILTTKKKKKKINKRLKKDLYCVQT